jgi:hypothetical protein
MIVSASTALSCWGLQRSYTGSGTSNQAAHTFYAKKFLIHFAASSHFMARAGSR